MIVLEPEINRSEQNLNGQDFTGQKETGANLFKITVQNTIFEDTPLRNAF